MTKQWSNEQSQAAVAQGWDMFDANGTWQLQGDDDSGVFKNDIAAFDHVHALAEAGDELAMAAMELDGKPVDRPMWTTYRIKSKAGKYVNFLAVRISGGNVRIMDEKGNNYGGWQKFANFKAKYQSDGVESLGQVASVNFVLHQTT